VYRPFFNPSAMAEPPGTNSSHLGSSPLPFPIPNFGNAFVEISALTTLIGSSVAESLILGNQGGAGVAWAAMSAFGLMDIVKTCVGAASPGWLRTVIGARSENTDAAVGLEVASSGRGRGAMKVRRSYGERGPSGLSVDASLFLNAVAAFTCSCNSHVLMTVPRYRDASKQTQNIKSSGKRFTLLIS
jgi:hypothetical protein